MQILPFLLTFTFLLGTLVDAATFNVNVRPLSAAQKQAMSKWRQNLRQVGFKRPKGTFGPREAGKKAVPADLLGRQDNSESSEIDDLDIMNDPYFYRIWLNPVGTIKLGIPRMLIHFI